ncbi:TonB-dependent receptor [Pontibacter sp. E15-1]|uniref:TonB-dependent receptor n=1 Tax=Pontibacter sp. E15-1 TaxID=2919918 RepID=UPI001F50169D|nr:TonB-dependent receptor [Pontibacter sp. E15-1]MCJ8164522.1 TonB-dependent receptor [Pontibacter sp. E15-1]
MTRFYTLTLTTVLLLFLSAPCIAQKALLRGVVRATSDGEVLAGATVAVPALNIGTVTNEDGFYTLSLPAGEHTVQASYLGYTAHSRQIKVETADQQRLNFSLNAANTTLKEVNVETNTLRQKLNDTRMSVETLTAREAKLLPALFGEVDLVKVLQLKPGVQSGGEGSSGLYVRGGGPDQNLVLVDEALVYNPSHLFGFFSVFNPDAVKNVELYKGGFPAQYGGRLSSVMEVKLKEGNNERVEANGGLGLIASRLTVDGPIVKDKLSFLVSGRRTYADLLTRQVNRLNEDQEDYSPIPDYYFYDLNAKLSYKISPNDELTLSGYYGRDFFGFDDDDFKFGFDWGNTMANLRWRHKFNRNLIATTSLYTTSYQYNITNEIDVFKLKLSSAIRDYTFKTDFDLFLKGNHSVKFGATATHHRFTIGRLNFQATDSTLQFGAGNTFGGVEFGAYASDDYQLNARLSLNYGLRLSGFSSNKTYMALEPRVAAKYTFNETTSLKASFASMKQYVHLVSNSGSSLPTDVWYPSTADVAPQRSQQAALGVSKLFGRGRYLITNEVYYKWMRNQLDFRDGANLFVNDSLQNEFLFGIGRSYGNEVYLEKIKGKTTGWIGYTLSWTDRKFDSPNDLDDINGGRWFPTRYDRRHDLSVVVMHQLNKRLSLTGTFIYSSGNPFSVPLGRFAFQDVEGKGTSIVPVYEDRNSYRLSPYHRLDLSAVLKLKPKHGAADLTFSVYNVYNRRNPYFVYFDQVKDQESRAIIRFQAKQVSLFPLIPSVTYNFKF